MIFDYVTPCFNHSAVLRFFPFLLFLSRETVAMMVLLVPQGELVRRATVDPVDHQDLKDLMELQAHQVPMDLQDHKENEEKGYYMSYMFLL